MRAELVGGPQDGRVVYLVYAEPKIELPYDEGAVPSVIEEIAPVRPNRPVVAVYRQGEGPYKGHRYYFEGFV